MCISHLSLQLGSRNKRRYTVNHNNIHCVHADQRISNLQCLLAAVGLRDQQLVNVNPKPTCPGEWRDYDTRRSITAAQQQRDSYEPFRVPRIKCMLGVNERALAPAPLGLGDHL